MEPIIKAKDVQYCTLQCPDLDVQEQFLIHFGMHTVEKTDDLLLMRGEGPQPFIEKCTFHIIDAYRRFQALQSESSREIYGQRHIKEL